MSKILCRNGHFFDSERGRFCPLCGQPAADTDAGTPQENVSGPVTIQPISGTGMGSTVPPTPPPMPPKPPVSAPAFQPMNAPSLENMTPSNANIVFPDEPIVSSGIVIPETTVLSSVEAMPETTILSSGNVSPETTVLSSGSEGSETTVLSSGAGPSVTSENGSSGAFRPAPSIISESVPESLKTGNSASKAPHPYILPNGEQYCYYCFRKQPRSFVTCPVCGQVNTGEPKIAIQLTPGSMLQGRYIIGRAVGQGGFGIVYRAYDTQLAVVVAIKEYYPRHIVTRVPGAGELIITKKAQRDFEYFKNRFLAEARTMAKFNDTRSIPNVFEFFEENNTTYFVMEYLEGQSLRDYIIEHDGCVDEEFACYIATEVATALSKLHKANIIHRDVAPDNIFICTREENNKRIIKLMDLGAAKLTDGTDEGIDRVMKPGFSPAEQYDEHGNVGPWTDIYALGATLYAMLTGMKPEESTNRKIEDKVVPPIELNPNISENLNNTVLKAMAMEPHMRFRNADDMIKAINGEKNVVSLDKEKKRRRARQVSGILAGILVMAAAAIIVITQYTAKKVNEELQPADLEVWFSVAVGSSEEKAMESIREDFTKEYPKVTINLRAIPESEYQEELRKAANEGKLPDLFESSGLPENYLEDCRSVQPILKSEQAKDCLFLKQYSSFYEDYTRMPLGIEAPVAYVVTNGASCVDYTESYFKQLSDFGEGEALIAVDENYREMIETNFPELDAKKSRADFLNNTENTSPVMLSSTMALNEVRSTLTNYEKAFVYYDSDDICCRFIYEWSLGSGTKNEEKAADRLLSWMLGNAYQSFLMISEANDGQLPLNKTCFDSKVSGSKYLKSIESIYDNFRFER